MVRLHEGDIRDSEALTGPARGWISCSTRPPRIGAALDRGSVPSHDSNVTGTLNMLVASRDAGAALRLRLEQLGLWRRSAPAQTGIANVEPALTVRGHEGGRGAVRGRVPARVRNAGRQPAVFQRRTATGPQRPYAA